jgi:hypothetical protein
MLAEHFVVQERMMWAAIVCHGRGSGAPGGTREQASEPSSKV